MLHHVRAGDDHVKVHSIDGDELVRHDPRIVPTADSDDTFENHQLSILEVLKCRSDPGLQQVFQQPGFGAIDGESQGILNEHITSHHPYIGDYERDYEHEDICAFQSRMMLRSENPRLQHLLTGLTLLVHLLPLGPIIGDEIFPRLNAWLTGRPQKDPERHVEATSAPLWQKRLFIGVSLASNLTLLALFGPWALLYHLWSLSLFLGKFGIWNLGQSLSEHEGTDETAPTRSRYGPINWLLFNTGYHNEHHTFPNVAWSRLPELKRQAPEVFTETADKTYFGYWLDHVRGDFTASRRTPLHDTDNTARCAGRADAGVRGA